ncbi:MAG TPA: hypothetical protein VIJ16_00285, partial [Gemmatimonadaceae bacterium]
SALEPQLAAAPQLLAERGTSDDTAYEAYTRATGLIGRRGAGPLHRAIVILHGALVRDSTFAKAYAATARAYSLLPLYDGHQADSAITLGIAAATRAIALDSSLSDAYTARAALYNAGFRWADAERDFRHALSINPRDAAAHQAYGEFLLVQGSVRPALDELRRATALDATSAVALASYAIALGTSGDQPGAVAAARRAMALDSTVFVTRLTLGTVLIFGGHPDSALTVLEAASGLAARRRPTSGAVSSMLAYAYARVGDTQKAQAIAQAAVQAESPDSALILAHAMLGAGDTARALTALQSAAMHRAPQLTAESLAEPIFDSIRASPKFLDVLHTLALPVALAQKSR